MKKSELIQIIREEIKKINEVSYAPLPPVLANKWRDSTTRSMKKKTDPPQTKTRRLTPSQYYKLLGQIADVEEKISDLKNQFHDLNFEMEQTAEIEGGPIADRIGTEMNKVLTQTKREQDKLNKLQSKLI